MAEVIRMPLLSDTMKEGVIAEWHKQIGDTVKADEPIADVETDKATMEVLPYVDGTLLYRSTDKKVPVNGILAIVGKAGEDFEALLKAEPVTSAAPAENAKEASLQNPATEVQQSPAGKQENHTGEIANGNVSNQNAVKPIAEPVVPKGVTVVRMPLLSDTMREGKIVSWSKKEGDTVKGDDVLAEVETDKATMEVMGYADGTLLHIGVPAGEAAPVNGIIAIIGPAGTDISGILSAPQSTESPDATKTVVPEAEKPTPAREAAAPSNAPTVTQPVQSKNETADRDSDRLRISPLARRLAEEKGIDLKALHGSGDYGRIIKRDVDSYTPQQQPAAAPVAAKEMAAAPAAQNNNNGFAESFEDVPNSQMRNIIAARLSESKFSAPHFYLRISVEMDNAMQAREKWNAISPVKISFNDLTIKGVAMALRQNPDVNVSWMGDKIRRYSHIHVGTAVATDGGGLVVPVVRFADKKSLSEIAASTKELIGKVRDKKIQPQDYTGNTFTISNLGMMDIDEFTAIINPPDACILAVGKIAETPVVKDGVVTTSKLMKLTLSCDHRAVDGAVGARFLQSLKGFLENPVTMLV